MGSVYQLADADAPSHSHCNSFICVQEVELKGVRTFKATEYWTENVLLFLFLHYAVGVMTPGLFCCV